MTLLHELPDFADLVAVVARKEGLDPGLVEKDYWIMHCLWGLQQGGFGFHDVDPADRCLFLPGADPVLGDLGAGAIGIDPHPETLGFVIPLDIGLAGYRQGNCGSLGDFHDPFTA